MIDVEVVYALPHKQRLIALQVAPGTTVEQAIRQSGILDVFPEIDLSQQDVGVWYRPCKLDRVLQQGDRVEIYRPLIADPKEVRRRRAEKAKAEGRANKVTGGRPLATSKTKTTTTGEPQP